MGLSEKVSRGTLNAPQKKGAAGKLPRRVTHRSLSALAARF